MLFKVSMVDEELRTKVETVQRNEMKSCTYSEATDLVALFFHGVSMAYHEY